MAEQTATDIKNEFVWNEEELRKAIEFFGIELTPDGGTKFKLKTMNKWRYLQNETENATLLARVTELEGKLAAAEAVIRHYQNPKNWTDEDYVAYHQLDVTGKCTYLGADNGPDKANEYLEATDE